MKNIYCSSYLLVLTELPKMCYGTFEKPKKGFNDRMIRIEMK